MSFLRGMSVARTTRGLAPRRENAANDRVGRAWQEDCLYGAETTRIDRGSVKSEA